METQVTAVGAFAADDPFACAYLAFVRARTSYIEAREKVQEAQLKQAAEIAALPDDQQADMARQEMISDRLCIPELGNDLFDRMNEADAALDAMMHRAAPTSFALALKLQALAECPWEHGNYIDRLTADASTLSLQFAEVWLERWKRLGGTATTDSDNPAKIWIGHPNYCLSPVAEEDAERAKAGGLSEGHSIEQKQWHGAFYDGRARELSDFLDAMPGALAAVKAIIAENPARGLPSTQVVEA